MTLDIPCKCTRCRNRHMQSERINRPRPRRSTSEIQMSDLVCPRCGCTNFYDCTPQVAWCWASGLIEIGDAMPEPKNGDGAIEIASGPKFALKGAVSAMARHSQGHPRQLLVPGVPEATAQRDKLKALDAWLAHCGRLRDREVTWTKGGVDV